MKNRAYLKVFYKNVALVYGILLVICLTAIFVGFRHERASHIATIKSQENIVVESGRELIQDVISPVIADVEMVVKLSQRVLIAHSSDGDYNEAYPYLEPLLVLAARNKPKYDQIRYIDIAGKECVRVNNSPLGEPQVTSGSELQDKGHRYYFQEILNLNRQETYISPIDLNLEYGEVELPYKPVLRFGKPVYHGANKIGIVVINFRATYLFDKLHLWSQGVLGDLSLLNSDGYWLHGSAESDAWGFLFPERRDKNMSFQNPELWRSHLSRLEGGQVQYDNSFYTFRRIEPVAVMNSVKDGPQGPPLDKSNIEAEGDDYYWTLVSHVSKEGFETYLSKLKRTFVLLGIGSAAALGIFSFFLARAQSKRKILGDALKDSNANLENTVERRTRELTRRNEQLRREIDTREKIEEALAESQERYRSIMDAMDDGVYINSPDYTIEYVNPALSKKVIDDPIGKKCYEVLYNRESKCSWCIYDELDEGASIHYENTAPDNRVYHISNTIIRYHENKKGKLTIFRDITAYRNTQLELRESQKKYSLLLETMKEGLFSVDREAVITYSNPSLCRMLGVDQDSLVGRKVTEFLDENNAKLYRAEFAKRRLNRSEPYELAWKKQDGSELLTQISPAIFKDEKEEMLGSLGVVYDITDERQAEKIKRSLEQQLQQAQKMEALGTLAGGIAHDFNNILAAILGFGEIAQSIVQSRKDDELEELIGEITTAGRRAAELVKQILTFARQTKQQRQPLAVGPIVREALKLLRSAISTTIDINAQQDDGVGLVLADPTQIHQIVMNLCTNSCQAMLTTGGSLDVDLAMEEVDENRAEQLDIRAGKFICLSVEDSGHGIPPEILERVFDPFFTTKDVGKGTGLGLSVVHSIVMDLDGAIELDTIVDQGTTIRVFLPITQERESSEPAKAEGMLRGTGQRVAWVDDEGPLTVMGCKILNSLGYSASGYNDPLEFVEELRDHPEQFDLVISDFNMPKMNGIELFNRIKLVNPDILFILSSGYSEDVNEENAQDIGLASFLMKPASKEDIALAAFGALRKRQSNNQVEAVAMPA